MGEKKEQDAATVPPPPPRQPDENLKGYIERDNKPPAKPAETPSRDQSG